MKTRISIEPLTPDEYDALVDAIYDAIEVTMSAHPDTLTYERRIESLNEICRKLKALRPKEAYRP